MNWDAIGAIGEAIGAVAVVVTLVVLIVQLRQSTAEIRASSIRSLLDKSIDLFGQAMDTEIPAIVAKQRQGDALTEVELERFTLFVRRNLQMFEQVYLEHRNGRVDVDVMNAYNNRIRRHFSFAAWPVIWPTVALLYTESFRQHVNELANDSSAQG